jgi:N utilization substance protein A
MKGMRVQSIIRELRGEKIDIIEFSDEITTFAEKALQPAKVSRVSITDLTEKQLEVIVDDTQLSLAIGKKGQNVRLAAKLLGWKIDIKSEEEKRQEVEQQMQALAGAPTTPIEQVTELGDGIIQKLVTAGITTVEALADMTPEQLEEIPGIGEKTLEKISVAVRNYFARFEETQAVESEQTETAEGASEAVTPDAALATSEAEAENAAEVLEEAESEFAATAEGDEIEAAGEAGEALAEEAAESRNVTAAELAVEDVPAADAETAKELEEEENEAEGKDGA